MPTAIEKQIEEEESKLQPAESLAGEHRSFEKSKFSLEAISKIKAILLLLIIALIVYLFAVKWDQLLTLFQDDSSVPLQVDVSDQAIEKKEEIIAASDELETFNESKQAELSKPTTSPVESSPIIVPLPVLNESDNLFREEWRDLWSDPVVSSWADAEQLIRKTTALLDSFSQGRIVRDLLTVFSHESPFVVNLVKQSSGEEGSFDIYELDHKGYSRYTALVEAIIKTDTSKILNFYLLLRPLFQEAYKELGYTNKYIDEVVLQSLQRIQNTPLVEGQILLTRPKVMYLYYDSELENLSTLEKQLIRMGPDNTKNIQTKAKEFESLLMNRL